MVFAATMLAAAFLALLQRPVSAPPALLPWIASAWALLLPLATFLQVLMCSHHLTSGADCVQLLASHKLQV